MSTLADTLDVLKQIAEREQEKVAKTAPADDKPAETPVEKTDEPSDVMKSIAAVFQHGESQMTELRGQVSEAFELVAKSHQRIVSMIEELPQGRKSVARTLPPSVGHEDVGKTETVDEEVAKTDTLVGALKVLNKRTYGVE